VKLYFVKQREENVNRGEMVRVLQLTWIYFCKAIFTASGMPLALVFIYNRRSSKAVNLIVLQKHRHIKSTHYVSLCFVETSCIRHFFQYGDLKKFRISWRNILYVRCLQDNQFLESISEIKFHFRY
jgi:hypothetical protein